MAIDEVATERGADFGVVARLSVITTPWLGGLALGGLAPVLAAIGAHYAATPGSATVVRLLVTVVGGAMVFGAPLGGFVAEKIGEVRALLWFLALFALAGTAGYFVDSPSALLATRILLGIANGAIGVCAATLLTLRIPGHEQHKWLGFYATSGTVGSLIILPLAGKLGGIDWRLVFLLHLIALPILALILATVSRTRVAHPARAAGSAPLAPQRFPWHLVLVAIACGAIGSTMPAYLPFHLASLGETHPERIAGAMLPMALATGVVALFYGAVRRRLDVAPVFSLAFLLSAIGLGLVVIAPGYLMVLLGMGLLAPNLFAAAAAATAPEHRARTIGIVRAGFFGAPLLAQLPLEPITAAGGPSSAIAALAGFALVATLAVLVARRSFVFPAAMAAH